MGVESILTVLILFCVTYHATNAQENDQVIKMVRLVPAKKIESCRDGCRCVGFNCGCCVRVHIKEIKLDETACINVTYLPHDLGIQVTLVIGHFVVFNRTVSARNPPPICLAVPYLHKLAKLCFYFYNLDVSDKNFSGCAGMEIQVIHIIHHKVDFGCFHIPLVYDGPTLTADIWN